MNMSVSQEISEYFSELVKSSATNEILEDIFKKLTEEIISNLRKTLMIKIEKIDELEGKISIQPNTIEQLIIKCDDNKQYSRCSCLRIHGIKCSDY